MPCTEPLFFPLASSSSIPHHEPFENSGLPRYLPCLQETSDLHVITLTNAYLRVPYFSFLSLPEVNMTRLPRSVMDGIGLVRGGFDGTPLSVSLSELG